MSFSLPSIKLPPRLTARGLRRQWNHLSIGKKLNLAFGSLVLLTFLAVGRTYVSSVRANNSIRHAQTVQMPTALTSVSAQENLLRMLADLQGYMVTGESYFRDRYQQARQDFEADLLQMSELLELSTINADRLVGLRQLYDAWSGLPEQLFRLRDTPLENQPALQIFEAEGRVPMTLILDNAQATLDLQRDRPPSAASLRLINDLGTFQVSFVQVSTSLQNYLVTQKPSFRYDYSEALQAHQAAWEQLQQQRSNLTAEQRQLMEAIATQRQQFFALPDRLFAIVDGDQRRQDLYLFRKEAEPLALEMIAILDAIVIDEQKILTQELSIGQSAQATAQWQTLGVGGLALITGALMAMVLQRQMIRPLKQLTNATTQIKAGQFGVQAVVDSNDEIGALAAAFNHMSDYLQQSRQELEQYSQTLEHRVNQRTEELQQKNQQLETILRDLRKTQAQLIQTEKMSGLGQMVAGVAHEINNPVNFIYGNIRHAESHTHDLLDLIYLYQASYPDPSPELADKIEEIDLAFLLEDLPKILDSMQLGATRIREIVATLRNFARLDEADMKEADLRSGIDSTLMILQAKLTKCQSRESIEVVKDLGDVPPVECYPGQLNQVLMNILANAIDALDAYQLPPEKTSKVITVQTRCDFMLGTAVISIGDNGPGIDAETQQRLFDPFFTTKEVGKGTGLGLSISYQIVVEHHHGQLTCHSELGVGTEFRIEIPLVQTARRPSAPVAEVV